MTQDTLTLLFADGDTNELAPLTESCVKAAVPFGGEYRVIDFVLSNCLHSGLRRMLVFAGARSYPLHKHLRDAWMVFNPEFGEYITLVSGLMNEDPHGSSMFDRIVDNRTILERSRTKRVSIADAGQIYRMDYAALIQEHCDNAADITVAVISESQSHSTQRPIVLVDQNESRPDRILKITNSGVASR